MCVRKCGCVSSLCAQCMYTMRVPRSESMCAHECGMCVCICGRVSSLCAQCMHTMHVYVCMGVHECGLPRHVCIHKEVCLESLRTMYAYYARVGVHVCSWMCFYTACAYVQASVSRVSAHDVLYTMRIQVLVCVCVCVHGCRLARHVRMHMWVCLESPRTVYVYSMRV
jgi:hypothetical protein